MEKLHLRNTIHIVRAALEATIEGIFGIKDNKLPLIPFSKSSDFDYQSAFANKLYNSKKKDAEFNAKYKSIGDVVSAVRVSLLEKYPQLIKSADASEQGFLLLLLQDEYLKQEVNTILHAGIGLAQTKQPEIIAVDFSSPNIAKEMHVGHLRSTIMGESICRVLEFQGNDVHRINHLGDWGTQFGMLIAYLEDAYPDFKNHTPELSDLQTFYKAAKQCFDEDEVFKKRAQSYVVRLQQGDKDFLKSWSVLCDISRQFFNKIYAILDIKLEEFGESFYNPMIPAMLEELDKKGLTKIDNGAKCIFIPGKKVPLMVVKSDGGFNYDTTDMAAVKYRLETLKCNRAIYLTDLGQKPHFDLVFDGAKLAGWHVPPQTRLDHMGFGLICNEDGGKMKTRSGESAKLMDLIVEAKKRAKDQLLERANDDSDKTEQTENAQKKTQLSAEEIDEVAGVLGVAAIKYYDMRQNREQNYKFVYDEMLSQKGNTAVYLLYAYIRLCSILRKSNCDEAELAKAEFVFTDDHEKLLARHLVKFNETIEKVTNDLTLNTLCDYLYNLAVVVAECYRAYKINDNEHTKNRAQLILAAKLVMEKCFFLLGIKTITRI